MLMLVKLDAAPAEAAVAAETPAGQACAPAALVEGPPEIVGPIVTILGSHGVATKATSCGSRTVTASLAVQPGGGGYRLHVLDVEGHNSYRHVADAEMAASLIESWALDEAAELWAPRPVPSAAQRAATPPAPTVAERGPGGGDATVALQTQLGVVAETSVSPDAATWWGASGRACARVRALCLGGRADLARAETTLEIDRTLGIAPDLTRTLVGLSAFAAWPISARRLWVAPSVGVGLAWLHSNATQAGVTSKTDDILMRGQAGGVTGLAIGHGWSVGLAVDGSVALAVSGDGRQGTTTYVPAVPRGFLTIGVGVWYVP